METPKKKGVIRSWHAKRGFGVIRVGSEPSLERYYFHVTRIVSGTANPAVGQTVYFRISSKDPAEGQLRMAIDVDVDMNAPIEAGKATEEGVK